MSFGWMFSFLIQILETFYGLVYVQKVYQARVIYSPFIDADYYEMEFRYPQVKTPYSERVAAATDPPIASRNGVEA